MDKGKALELIRQYIQEIPTLKSLQYEAPDYDLWESKVNDVIRAAFGEKSLEYKDFNPMGPLTIPYALSDTAWRAWRQKRYLENLNDRELGLKKIVQRHDLLGLEPESQPTQTAAPPKAFIAHGGETSARNRLEGFLTALGVTPIIAEKQPTEGRSVGQHVDWCLDQCDCSVILATKGDVDGKTGKFIPRGNVSVEIGKCQERFPNRTIYLLEEDTRFPSDVNEKVWERFTQDNMERAFLKTARELVAFGFLKAVKES